MQVFESLWNNLYARPKVKEETLLQSNITIIQRGDFEMDKYNEIAVTGAGKFYPGTYQGEKVTIKVVDVTIDDAIINEFLLWKLYSDNPMFLKMKGVSISYGKAYIILENFLYTLETAIESRILNQENKLKIAKQCLEIVSFLQKEKQYLLDIRPGIFSINEKMEIKLIDFCFLVNHQSLQNNDLILSTRMKYSPPEYYHTLSSDEDQDTNLANNLNSSYDIWSFGCLLIDIFSKESSIITSNLPDDYIKSGIINGSFPSIPSDINSLLRDIISRCLNKEYSNRISIEELTANLRIYIDDFSANNSIIEDTEVEDSVFQNPLLKDQYVYAMKIDKDTNYVNKLINEQLQENVANLKKNISLYQENSVKKIEETYDNIIKYLQTMKNSHLELIEKFKNKILSNILMMQSYYSTTMEDMMDIQNKISEIKLNITTLNKFSNQEKYSNLLSSIESGKEYIQKIIERYSENEKFDKINLIFEQNQHSADLYQQFSNNDIVMFDSIYQQIQNLNFSTNDLRYELSTNLGFGEEVEKEKEENSKKLSEQKKNEVYIKAQENSNLIIIYNSLNKSIEHYKYQNVNNPNFKFNSKSYSLYDPIHKCVYISGGLQDISNKYSYDNSFYQLSFSFLENKFVFNIEQLSPMLNPRISHSMLQLTANPSIFIAISGHNTKTCEAYNSSLNIWKSLPDLPAITSNPSCIDYADFIYVFSPEGVFRCDIVNSEEIQWETLNFDIEGRLKKGMGIVSQENKVFLFGGFDIDKMYNEIYIIDFDKNYIEEAKDIVLPNRGFYNSNAIVKSNVIILMDANNCVTEYDSENNMFYYYT